MLSDREIQNILRIQQNGAINPLNFRVLGFNGLADGTKLTRLYSDNDIKNNYIRIISIYFEYYSKNGIWVREVAEDNKLFTNNANTRYSLLRPYTKLDSFYFSRMLSTNKLDILVDNNSLNIFPETYNPAFDKIDLNVITQSTITDGIDMKYNLSFYTDMEGNLADNPYVTVSMFVELLDTLAPIKITKTITDT